MYLCIGYSRMNQERERVFREMKGRGIHPLTFVNPHAVVMTDKIGEGCLIFEDAIIGPYTKVGDANIFRPRTLLSHHSVCGDFNYFAPACSIAGHVTIGSNCFIGNNSSTKDGISVSNYTLVGSGCNVSKSTKEYSVVVPARSVTLDNHISTDFM